jgi:hypothetical protein
VRCFVFVHDLVDVRQYGGTLLDRQVEAKGEEWDTAHLQPAPAFSALRASPGSAVSLMMLTDTRAL